MEPMKSLKGSEKTRPNMIPQIPKRIPRSSALTPTVVKQILIEPIQG